MPYTGNFQAFEDIIQEVMMVYQHDARPWLIGYSGGKDSTLLVALVYEAIARLPEAARTKKGYAGGEADCQEIYARFLQAHQ